MHILKFPESRQTYSYDCGAKAVQAVLIYYGIDIDESTVFKIAGTSERGTSIKGIQAVIKQFKLKHTTRELTTTQLKKYVAKKIPVIILVQAWPTEKVKNWKNCWTTGHFVVVIGFDKKNIYFEDPFKNVRTYLPFKQFEDRWHDKDLDGKRYEHLGIAIYGKKPSYHPEKAILME